MRRTPSISRILSITRKSEPWGPLGAPSSKQSSRRLKRVVTKRGLLSLPVRWTSSPPMEALGFGHLFFPEMLRASQEFALVTGGRRK